ncbi:MAG: hypothetical protein IPJ69_07815 [Deltaproteobacteria bacterium]|nr:MAG: hypothetical protein IPJ69_07815 [Deltaproteobacteria bacterium]
MNPFIKAGLLLRFTRGFYVTPNCQLEHLSQRISPKSALSLGTVLAKELIIGSTPNKTIYAVKTGRSRTYTSSMGRIVHLGLSKHLWFGYDQFDNGVRSANKEKAFLDTLYFYQKGQKFSFNVYSDIDVSLLNKGLIQKYLGNYPNPKFRKFVQTIINQGA